MRHPNQQLIENFYHAFQRLDAEAMCACYADQVHFSDPVFSNLRGAEAGNMWRMLTSRAQNFSLVFDQVQANDTHGSARWIATYVFGQTGKVVVNEIEARFEFADGKIIRHRDHFDLWKWSRQALGLRGGLLGWATFFQEKVRLQASRNLQKFSAQ